MPLQVCMGALLKCSMGVAPSSLAVLPINRVLTQTPDANIMDHVPMLNIMPFGMCQAPANPAVIAATAAALGTPTPAPCIPATPAPWMAGAPTVHIANLPALDNTSKLTCIWGGMIEVTNAGQTTVQIP
jgi:hypothetical protein